jgi:hypothetical protein
MATPLQTYSNRTFIQRIKNDLNNDLPNSNFTISDNLILFHIDQAKATAMIGNVYANAKVEGVITMPEGFLTTYLLSTLLKDESTAEWYADLPQPPVSLPLGYSLTDAYFASSVDGLRTTLYPIESKRVPYREHMPMMPGTRYRVVGKRIYAKASNGGQLLGKNLYVTMAKTRSTGLDEELNLPDDVIDAVYNLVMDKMKKRIMNPQDIIQDGLPAGNKSS